MALREIKDSREHAFGPLSRETWTYVYVSDYSEADRVCPMPGDLMPGSTTLYCTTVTISPFAADKARITVVYSNEGTSRASQDEIDQIEESLDITCETATTTVDAAGNPVGGRDVTFFRPLALYRLSVTREKEISIQSILRLIGTVNSRVWRGAAPETVLFQGCTLRRRGQERWRAEYAFLYNNDDRHKIDANGDPVPRGWNNPVDRKTGAISRVYDRKDFALLGLED